MSGPGLFVSSKIWASKSDAVGTVTCTVMSFKKRGKEKEQISAAKLLEIRSQGATCSYDISGVCETLGRTIVGQGVSLVVEPRRWTLKVGWSRKAAIQACYDLKHECLIVH